jgi:hypothetical protein
MFFKQKKKKQSKNRSQFDFVGGSGTTWVEFLPCQQNLINTFQTEANTPLHFFDHKTCIEIFFEHF